MGVWEGGWGQQAGDPVKAGVGRRRLEAADRRRGRKSGGTLVCGRGRAGSTFQGTGCGVWKARRGVRKDSEVLGREMRRLAFVRDQTNRPEVWVSIRHGHRGAE